MEGRNSFMKLGPRLGRKYLLCFLCIFDGYLGDGGVGVGGWGVSVEGDEAGCTVQVVCLLGNEAPC